MDTEVFILRILRARSTRVLQYHHFMILVIFASSNLDGDSASPYPRFPAIFSKNRNGILASQGNFKIVYISCGDEVRDYVFEKILKKCCIRPSQNLDIWRYLFYPSSAIRFIHF